jgi:xylulokinase
MSNHGSIDGNSYVIGLDLGTSGLKLVLLDREGAVRHSSFEALHSIHPKPAWAEQNAQDWTAAIVRGVRGLRKKAHVSSSRISAIGITGHIDGVVPVGVDGKPLRNAILWMDRRAKPQSDWIRTKTREEDCYDITGLAVDPSHVAPKILWIRDNEPKTFRRSKHFLLPTNYVFYFLTHRTHTDHSNASCTMLYDIKHQRWSEHMCDLLGISIETLPEMRDSTDGSAVLRADLAKKLGLRDDVIVTVGGGDEEIGAVGAGVISQDELLDLTGTSEPMCLSLNEPFLDPTRLMECHAHGYPGKWLLENTGGLAGGIHRWFVEQFVSAKSKATSKEDYGLLNREIASVPAGSEGLVFLPFFSGSILPEWNPDARGVILGLTLSHTRQHIARSIMEGTSYVLKDVVNHLTKIGHEPKRIVLAGGGSRAEVWRRIKTDVINRSTVSCLKADVTALGAAMTGAVAAGFYRTLDEAVRGIVRTSRELSPGRKEVRTYERTYLLYREAYETLKPVFKGLTGIQADSSRRT